MALASNGRRARLEALVIGVAACALWEGFRTGTSEFSAAVSFGLSVSMYLAPAAGLGFAYAICMSRGDPYWVLPVVLPRALASAFGLTVLFGLFGEVAREPLWAALLAVLGLAALAATAALVGAVVGFLVVLALVWSLVDLGDHARSSFSTAR